MNTLSKIVIATAAAAGIALTATAFAHGPGSGYGPGYGQGMGMMGPHGTGYGMHGMNGGGPRFGMHGMYGGGPGAGMHGMYGGGSAFGMHDMNRGADGSVPCLGAETIGARLDAIESELKLTAEQTQAWKAFEDAVRTQVQSMAEAHPHGSQNPDEHIAFMEQRLEGMKAVQKARTDLYDVLTPEQKATVDRYGFRGPRA